MRFKTIVAAAILSLAPLVLSAETRLLMAETEGCAWCERWNREISEIYPKTPEGQAAPLQRFDKDEGAPEGVTLVRRVAFTPTFILVRDGKELDRIEGYPGEDFFWGLLDTMLERAEIDYKTSG